MDNINCKVCKHVGPAVNFYDKNIYRYWCSLRQEWRYERAEDGKPVSTGCAEGERK